MATSAFMIGLLHSNSARYALALWFSTVMALLIAFVLQLEPAQWAGITVWIIFVQNPRMNYSKVIWWSFGTVVGAMMAVVLIACFNQMPELFFFSLALWLGICAATSTFVKIYRAYGWVLAGYTCCIVSMSALDTPDMVFKLAATRVSCIFIGMGSAILWISVLLPKHNHWKDTLHQLREHFKGALFHSAAALRADPAHPAHSSWRLTIERLSTIEHTLDFTTGETADSRANAPQARSLAATLICFLAKAQAIEIHLSRSDNAPAPEVETLLQRIAALFTTLSVTIPPEESQNWLEETTRQIRKLKKEVRLIRSAQSNESSEPAISKQFLLDRLDEVLEELDYAVRDWNGLFGSWEARRPSCLAFHHDYRTAWIYGARIFLALGSGAVICYFTGWSFGSQFILFIGVVCSLLSLLENAKVLGFALLKSAFFCFVVAFIEAYWMMQRAEGFILLALMLGIFLLPAAYAYRHPRLIGSAVISMLIFYGLTMPSNQMNYDILAFLNNGLGLLCAVVLGFFAFHAIPSLSPASKRYWLMHAVRTEVSRAEYRGDALDEQRWTGRMVDRMALLHRNSRGEEMAGAAEDEFEELLTSMQLGLRQIRVIDLLNQSETNLDQERIVETALNQFRKLSKSPETVANGLRMAATRLQKRQEEDDEDEAPVLPLIAELQEMAALIEVATPYSAKGHHV